MGFSERVLQHISPTSLALSLLGLIIIRLAVVRLDEHRRIKRLGNYGTSIQTYAPFGLDIALRGVYAICRHRLLEHWRDDYFRPGVWTAETRILGKRAVFTADPDNVKAILSTQFGDFGKGEALHHEFEPFLGDGIFATDGSLWQYSRQILRPQFTRARVSDLDCFETHVQTLFGLIPPGEVIDIADLFFRFTLDTATNFLLGADVQSLTSTDRQFATAFDEVQRIHSIWSRAFELRYLVVFPKYRAHIQAIDDFVNKFIDQALRMTPDELQASSEKSYTFLHELARTTRDPKVIRDQIVNVILAGRDTTAGTLSWAVYELARNPAIVARLRAEILETVGTENPPTYEHLRNMTYLRAVVDETLRLYPSVPFNLRRPLVDTTLPRGGGPDGSEPLPVLAGTPIGYSSIIIQRRPDLYPPVSDTFADPAVFSPERWANWQPRSQDYIPFNAGPRICLGQQFALTEVCYVLCRIFQRFARVENHMMKIDGGRPDLKTSIVLRPGQGVRVALYEDN
ncbi:hypothetical protein L249_7309 [Ophiocordyceps polyrhachis-furcata BCC 54312]|uniref:Cytochrome P450 n=1 Tax=Ophiocordyceps polyrhachis-furcata BCC 54312 TaxID=1330021 RepID=A0A367LA32_9HYPO|nr:hypothetical protein L249_7309 [Ophiocordyceps polyrhachis-furcata BCC 54312]